MQDRYVADVGDFGKYGLLRSLCHDLCLAVLWYLVPKESHTNDGRHVSYLQTGRTGPFERCDPDLFIALNEVVVRRRSVAVVERRRILPPPTIFHREPLVFTKTEISERRRVKRRDWFNGVLAVAARADVAFLDPDNGLQCKVEPHSKNGPKYAYYSDVRALSEIGQSLIVYHHLGRYGTAVCAASTTFVGRFNCRRATAMRRLRLVGAREG